MIVTNVFGGKLIIYMYEIYKKKIKDDNHYKKN